MKHEAKGFVRPVKSYVRSYAARANQEPSQDFTVLDIVLRSLELIGRSIDQVDVTGEDRAILMQDGDRIEIQVDPWDTPETLQPRLMKELGKMPIRWPDDEVANALKGSLHSETKNDSRLYPEHTRIERGRLA